MMYRCVALACLSGLAPAAVADVVLANRVIRAGELIGSEDVELGTDSLPGTADRLVQVIGLEARGVIYSGRPIRLDQFGPPTLVARNQLVVLVFVAAGLRIEAEGRALDRGSLGESVRVMNLASRRIVQGLVLPDGSISVGVLR